MSSSLVPNWGSFLQGRNSGPKGRLDHRVADLDGRNIHLLADLAEVITIIV